MEGSILPVEDFVVSNTRRLRGVGGNDFIGLVLLSSGYPLGNPSVSMLFICFCLKSLCVNLQFICSFHEGKAFEIAGLLFI